MKFRNNLHRLFLVSVAIGAIVGSTGCASHSKSNSVEKSTMPSAQFPSESVREAYLRLKKRDLSEQELKQEVEISSNIAKRQSQNMIEGAANLGADIVGKNKTYFLEGAEELELENRYFDIPVTYNEQVKKWMSYFLNRGRGFFQRYAERAGRYAPILGAILEEHGMPRDLIFLAMAESGFNNTAKSWAKAVGPWQFMPYTGKMYGLEQDWYKDERRDPIKATVAAARYLTKLYGDFDSWEIAAAAYNAGEGKLSRAIQKYRTEDFWDLTKGKYLKDETKNYVPKIMALAIIGKNLKSFGFDEIDFHEPLDFDEIVVQPATDLMKLAEALQVDFEEIQRLNPEVMRWFTPPNIADYKLRIPPNTAEKFAQCCSKMDLIATDFQEYVITKNTMKLSEVSKKFKIKKDYVIAGLNGVSENKVFTRGESVKLPFKVGEVVSASNNLYADLFEKPRREVLRKSTRLKLRRYASRKKPARYYSKRKREESNLTVSARNKSKNRVVASNSSDRKTRKTSRIKPKI